jgi:predicted nucleic acid-binding protein
LDQAVRRLAQYRPFAHEGLDARLALRDLILAAAVEGDGSIASLGECRDTCQTLWGLEVEIDELRSAFSELIREGQLEKQDGGYVLAAGVKAEVDLTLRRESTERERLAFEEWERTLKSIRAGLTDEEIALLRSDLEVWLRQLMLRHGVESALLLYPENPRAQEMLNQLEEMGLDFLPARSRGLEALREQAFALFVRQPTENQRILLANLMNTSYFLTVLSLDPGAKQLMEEVARGQRVYLDTNIVYRLLNLQTARQFLSTQRMLHLTTELGYSLAVTPWTIQELRTSLERARTYLKSKAVPPGELAALAAAATTDENFITAYWRRLKDKPVSVDDFFDFYNEIEEHLAVHGVEVVNEGTLAVDRDEAGIDEQLGIIQRRAWASVQAGARQDARRKTPVAGRETSGWTSAFFECRVLVPDRRQLSTALRQCRSARSTWPAVLRHGRRVAAGDTLTCSPHR